MVLFTRTTCLLAAFVLFSGVARAQTASQQDMDSIHVLGVFSQLGDQIEIKKVGVTVFGNRVTQLPVAEWRLNEMVVDEASRALASQFTIKVAPFGVSVLNDVKQDVFHIFTKPTETPFVAMPSSGLDAYLVFLPASEPFPYPSNQSAHGLGLMRVPGASTDRPGTHPSQFDGTFLARTNPTAGIVYALYDIYLIDAKTGRAIAKQQGQIPTRYHQTLGQALWYGTPYEPIGYPLPHLYISEGVWSDTADALTDAQKQVLRDNLTSLLKDSIRHSLAKMALTLTDPAETAPAPH